MKKRIAAVLAIGMCISMLGACGFREDRDTLETVNDTQPKETMSEETRPKSYDLGGAAAANGHKLRVAAWGETLNIPALEAAAVDYRDHVDPEFELEIEEVPEWEDVQEAITMAGGTGNYSMLTDVLLVQDHWIHRYVKDYPEAFVSIDDAGVDWTKFQQEKISYSTIDGIHYGFPMDNATVVCAYRVDLLKKCGYTLDDLTGVTWDRFIEIGSDVYRKTGKYLMCMDGKGNDLPYIMMQAEGKSMFLDGHANIAGNATLQEILGKIDKMLDQHVLALSDNWLQYSRQISETDEVAGVMNGNWILAYVQENQNNSGKWEITTLPTLSGKEGYASNGGSSLYITANCKNTELAKDFLAYTFGGSTATYDAALKRGSLVTTCLSANNTEVYRQKVAFFQNQPIYAKIVEMGAHVPVIEQNDYHYTCRELLSQGIYDIQGGKKISAVLEQVQEDLNYEMSRK